MALAGSWTLANDSRSPADAWACVHTVADVNVNVIAAAAAGD